MRTRYATLILCLFLTAACGTSEPSSPLKTFQTYVKAIKAKDTTSMKLLLSDATIKMHEQEAKSQGVTVDDIVKRETLFSESQKTVEFRNEKIDGDTATLEVKNSFGSWETVPFVREGGVWKIDKKGFADNIMRDVEDGERRLNDMINSPIMPEMTPDMTPPGIPPSMTPMLPTPEARG
jgi:hypothetical protein